MTDHCYIAVKGSLHSTDSCVFGLTTEEIIALSKRFSDSCKEVINGVLFKGNPIKVINVLGEIGYRVICSSGETEIVWTLRREVLVSKRAENQDETCRQSIAKNIISLGQSDLPQKAISGAGRKSSVSPLRRANEENTRNQSLTPNVEKTEKERKKQDKLGSKPEDIAEYGKKGSTIDLQDLDTMEQNPTSPQKKVLLNTNLSSEYNPLSGRNLEPFKKKDFITTYSETMADPAETTANANAKKMGGVNCKTVCQTSNPRNYGEKQIYDRSGVKPEFVLAEYTAESTMANAGPGLRKPISTAGKALNECPVNLPSTQYTFPQSDGRNQNVPQGVARNQNVRPTSPNPTIQKRKTVERIGTKPDDFVQFGTNKRKIDVVGLSTFVDMTEDDVIEKRIILNTNDSSEGNPMSTRNLEPQEDLMSKYGQSSRRRN